mgnify:CR=1 FL=1|tara:strand:- start:20958 stop:21419 length:462 start_codon:yes stop_codon:yes gene_type:complete
MKTLAYILFFLSIPFAYAQHDHSHEPSDAVVKLPDAKDQVEWPLLAKLDLKSKSADKTLVERLKKPLTLNGFAIPLDFDKKVVDKFLFVPFVPTCMHVPPPAENQLIHVMTKKPIKVDDLMYPLQISGSVDLDLKQTNDVYFNMKASNIKVAR